MKELNDYIRERKLKDPEFAKNYETEYNEFKIGVLLKLAREEAGLTQEEVAKKLHTKKSAISRIENHADDIKLSTLKKFVEAIGKELHLQIG